MCVCVCVFVCRLFREPLLTLIGKLRLCTVGSLHEADKLSRQQEAEEERKVRYRNPTQARNTHALQQRYDTAFSRVCVCVCVCMQTAARSQPPLPPGAPALEEGCGESEPPEPPSAAAAKPSASTSEQDLRRPTAGEVFLLLRARYAVPACSVIQASVCIRTGALIDSSQLTALRLPSDSEVVSTCVCVCVCVCVHRYFSNCKDVYRRTKKNKPLRLFRLMRRAYECCHMVSTLGGFRFVYTHTRTDKHTYTHSSTAAGRLAS